MTPDISCATCRRNLGMYVVGGLSAEGRSRIAAHLAGCADCSAEEARLRIAMISAAPRSDARPATAASRGAGAARGDYAREDYAGQGRAWGTTRGYPRGSRGYLDEPPPLPGSWRRGRRGRAARPLAVIGALTLAVVVAVVAFGLLRGGLPGGNSILSPLGMGHQGLDALSPDLGRFVAAQGDTMGVQVYDITHDRYYEYKQDTPFLMASSAKVYILLAYLDKLEAQGKTPSANDTQLLTAMIEHSDNNAAQALYNRLGYDKGQKGYLDKIGVPYQPNENGWGWAQTTPAGMTKALTLLRQGKILTADDRKLALDLMGQIEADQRMGVGDTAPDGATFSMKDGWVPGPDNLWALNSSGIVTQGKVSYVISVYSQRQPTQDWSKVNRVCGAVAKALLT